MGINHYELLCKNLYPKRKKLADNHGWAYPMEDRIHSIRLQQEQIAFGNDTEKAISGVFSSIPNVKILDCNVTFQKYDRKKSAVIDHVLDLGNVILVLEQKLKDNHDSTKNTGQYDDLIEKTEAVKAKYPGRTVIPVMFFLTDVQKGARKKFTELLASYGGRVCYGKELFDVFFSNVSNDAWNKLDEAIKAIQRTETAIIDYDTDEVIDEVKSVVHENRRVQNRIRKVLTDPTFATNVLPAVSKSGRFKKEVLELIDGPSLF